MTDSRSPRQDRPNHPYGFDLLRSPTTQDGPIITGGWDESVPVISMDDEESEDAEGEIRIL